MENEASRNFALDHNAMWLGVYCVNIIPPHTRNSPIQLLLCSTELRKINFKDINLFFRPRNYNA